MKHVLTGLLSSVFALIIGFGIFAISPIVTQSTVQAFHGDPYHDSDEYYGEQWVYTGNHFYYYDGYYAGWRCEWAVYKVYRRPDGSYYKIRDRYEWHWC